MVLELKKPSWFIEHKCCDLMKNHTIYLVAGFDFYVKSAI